MTMSQPLVTIITPAYNAERFIRATIESVRSQTYTNWEHLIVLDQNSKDKTPDIVEQYMEFDSRIRLIRSPKAYGAANNRNIGIEEAKGELIAFIDSDDLWFPGKLAKQVKFMEEKKIDFSYHPFIRMSEDGSKFGEVMKTPGVLCYRDLLRDNTIGCLTVMLRKSAFSGRIEFQNDGWEDMSLWLKLLRDGSKTYGLSEPLAYYRIVKGSRSNNKIFAAGLRWDTYRKVEKLSISRSTYYFLHYAINSVVKYSRF